MTRIQLSNYGSSPFERLIGHNQPILDSWVELENELFQSSSLSLELLEQVRRTLAFGNECEYCMVKGGRPALNSEDKRIQLAIAFAELFALDHKSIADEHFEMLRDEFKEHEIADLCAFVSFITACQKLGRILNLTEDLQEQKVTSMEQLKDSST
ncbi:MAG: carboxymuconolactone decarboxylase family protein [Bacteroidota bacterium]